MWLTHIISYHTELAMALIHQSSTAPKQRLNRSRSRFKRRV